MMFFKRKWCASGEESLASDCDDKSSNVPRISKINLHFVWVKLEFKFGKQHVFYIIILLFIVCALL